MNLQDKVMSVVVITYKDFSYVFDTLNSILAQDYPAIEILICDDGSSSFPKKEICDYLDANKKENIVRYELIHHEVNVGTVKNINIGIVKSTGKFVKIIAGDDMYYDEYVFSRQVKLLKENPKLMIVTGKTCECDSQMKEIYKEQVENTNRCLDYIFNYDPKEYFAKCAKENLFPLVTQALCFRREFFDQFGLYDEKYKLLEDPPMQIRIIMNKVPIGVIEEFVVKHRASVGISANEELFSKKRQMFYLDMVNYIKNERLTRPEIFPHHYTKQTYKKELFRYEMTNANKKWDKVRLIFRNLDTIFWFVIYSPRKAIEKVKKLIKIH